MIEIFEKHAEWHPADPLVPKVLALLAASDRDAAAALFARGGEPTPEDASLPELLRRPRSSPAPKDQAASRLQNQIAEIQARIAATEGAIIATFEQLPSSNRLPIAAEVQTLLAAGDRSGAADLITHTWGS